MLFIRCLAVFFCSLPLVADAEIYRWKDADGNVIYSDTPRDGAEKVEISEPTIVPSGPTQAPSTGSADDQKPVSYEFVRIASPEDDLTIRENVANIRVVIELSPRLQTRFGHKLQLMHDGQSVGEASARTTYQLGNVDRGAHTLQAVVLDRSGRAIKRSKTTSYFVHKQFVRRNAGS